jgi:hypothetical protein
MRQNYAKEKHDAGFARNQTINTLLPKHTSLVLGVDPDILCTPRVALLLAKGDSKQVDLDPRRAHTHALQPLPPRAEASEADSISGIAVAQVQLNHDLTNRQHAFSTRAPDAVECIHHCVERCVFTTLDIDLQDVDVAMVVLLHERGECVEWRRGIVFVFLAESNLLEESAVALVVRNLSTPAVDGEIIAPDACAGHTLHLAR